MIPFQSLFTVRTYHCYSSYLNKEKKECYNKFLQSTNNPFQFTHLLYFSYESTILSPVPAKEDVPKVESNGISRSSRFDSRRFFAVKAASLQCFFARRPRISRHVRWFLGLRKLSRFSIWIFTLSRARLALRWWWFPPVFWVGFLRSDFSLFWFNFTVAGLTVADESLA